MTSIAYTIDGFEYDYEPSRNIGRLGWFNIANCARQRMTSTAHNLEAWRGNRRAFYTALQKMDVETIVFQD